MKPIYELLLKDNMKTWSAECDQAFKSIKSLVASDTILVHFNPELPIILSCDASQYGVAAALTRRFSDGQERPIGFVSRTLSPAERNYSMIDKESLALYYGVKKFEQYLFGTRFTLRTDHKPLLALLGEYKGIPQMAASRLQCWALYLSAFNYRMEHIQGTKNNLAADMLSRSPLESTGDPTSDHEDCSYLNYVLDSTSSPPLNDKKIKTESRRDVILSRVMDYVSSGWPCDVESADLKKPYERRKHELSVEQGVLLWGYRVVIPSALRSEVLDELHCAHLGIVKMKSWARQYVWWPKLDDDLETAVKSCMSCLKARPDPERARLTPWNQPDSVWERLHLDFAGPFYGKVYLIVLDAISNWVEVFPMSTPSTSYTIDCLREAFSRFGLPKLVVTDNGAQFKSKLFADFLNHNGIRHVSTSPGHPATNGAAENSVKTFKSAMSKAFNDIKNRGVSSAILIARFLLSYRSVEHCVTKESPAKLLMGRHLRTRLDLLRPDRKSAVQVAQEHQVRNFRGRRTTSFPQGNRVLVRDYRDTNKKSWTEAVVERVIGSRTYLCRLPSNLLWKRHTNQIMEIGPSQVAT